MSVSQSRGHKRDIQEFFDEGAERWRTRYSDGSFDAHNYRDRMRAALGYVARYGPPRGLVFDAGCGAGVQAAAAQRLGHSVFALDISREMAREADDGLSEGAGGALVGDLDHVPFPDETFDVVLSLGVIGYAEDQESLITSLRRVLKPGGLLVISSASERYLMHTLSDAVSYVPDRLYLGLKRALAGRKREQGAEFDPGFYVGHNSYIDAPDFERFLAMHGFEPLAATAVNFGRVHFMGKRMLPERADVALSRGCSWLSGRAPMRFLRRYARTHVVAARKGAVPEPSPAERPPPRFHRPGGSGGS